MAPVVHGGVANLDRRARASHQANIPYGSKSSGVRPIAPRDSTQQREEIRRLYKQLSDGTLDLSPPSVPPMMKPNDNEPETEKLSVSSSDISRPAPRDRGVLVRVDGPSNGRVYSLRAPELSIGRSPGAAVHITDDGVSRRHALLVRTRGHYFVQDLDSSNGTFLEGRRVRRAPLMEGDLVQFGPNAAFRFCVMDHQQEQSLKRLYEETTIDGLTRVYNRRFLDQRLQEEVAYARRHRTELSLALIDIDHFKSINDRYGHQTGDRVLESVAKIIQDQLRTEDVVARYGGEEFALVLRGVPLRGAASVADRIRAALQGTTLCVGSASVHITLSAGCASLSQSGGSSQDTLLAEADERLYLAKKRGRNQVIAD